MSFEDVLESSIEASKKVLKRGEALKRLTNSSDFRAVIVEGYLRDHAIKLVYDRSNSEKPDDNTSRQIDAVAHFKAFLDKVLEDMEIAEKEISEASEQLYRLRNGEIEWVPKLSN